MRTSVVVVPTCDRDKWFSDIAIDGIRKFMPEAMIFEMHDQNKKLEVDVPDDIRELCDAIPYLKKQVYAPFLVDGIDDIYILDSDCFLFARPTELIDSYSYQGHTLLGSPDYPWGVDVWRSMGHCFPKTTPLFCAGMFKAPRTMWTYNRELMYDYLRQCVKLGYNRPDWQFRPVTFDQNLAAGLWRKTCKDNPLPALEYPLGIPTVDMKIFHACYFRRRPEFKIFLEDYKRMLET